MSIFSVESGDVQVCSLDSLFEDSIEDIKKSCSNVTYDVKNNPFNDLLLFNDEINNYKSQSSSIQHTCGHCGKSYKQKASLYNHEKYGCGKDPQFKCKHCNFVSKWRHSYKLHLYSKHDILI